MFKTPVLLLIFNRPEQTRKVFDELRRQAPQYLYIAADGPRVRHPEDQALAAQCREIVSHVDWDCEVKTLFRSENLGCGAAPAGAITWFFDQVEEGIILEDDCLPNESFFRYCESLLERYRYDSRIMAICGTSYQSEPLDNHTYYFSRYVHVWGWASWKRAWASYSFNLAGEHEATREAVIRKTFTNGRERRMWVHNMQLIVNGLDAWDYQLMYWIWKNDGLAIVPWRNMVSNIGFGELATHTLNSSSAQANIARHDIIAVSHPLNVRLNKKADSYERYHILIPTALAHYKLRMHAVLRGLKRLLRFKNG
jgi:hypothetical protein